MRVIYVITGEIKSKIDQIWNAFWSGGISNPLEVMEQMTYLLFIRRLDEIQITKEKKANRLKKEVEHPIFTPEQDHLRWSKFITLGDAATLYNTVANEVFPFIKNLGAEDETTYSHHMKDARFTIPTPALLTKVVDLVADVPMDDKDTKGDIYEYMLGKIASAGQNGQFRTPRHIIKMIVELMQPKPTDTICDPACGTAGFLVAASEYLNDHYSTEIFANPEAAKRFSEETFFGYDFDSTMLRIGSMNMMLHGVENPQIINLDSLSKHDKDLENKFSLILANPPFSGSLDYEICSPKLLSTVRTKKTELLFVALFEKLLLNGGMCAAIVPNGVLESDSNAHEVMRKKLIHDCRLIAIISLPHWVFKPYASVATSIIIFQKASTTEKVWYYRVDADGFTDGANKMESLENDIPELLNLWKAKDTDAYKPNKTKHRFISKEDILANGYDLCHRAYLNGYSYPENTPRKKIKDLFNIVRGQSQASTAISDGEFPFITSSAEFKTSNTYQIDSEAIIIPTVSSTGHGHASLKNIHYMNGKFNLATICIALIPKDKYTNVQFVYYYLLKFKEELLVALMRGAANVSLNLDKLDELEIPQYDSSIMQKCLDEISQMESEILKIKEELLLKESQLSDLKSNFGGSLLGK